MIFCRKKTNFKKEKKMFVIFEAFKLKSAPPANMLGYLMNLNWNILNEEM